jgi:hypothetical protein
MSLIAARTALIATRRIASQHAAQQSKRRMGSAAAPEWTGIDKVVRGYFPGDDQREFFSVGWCDCSSFDVIIK